MLQFIQYNLLNTAKCNIYNIYEVFIVYHKACQFEYNKAEMYKNMGMLDAVAQVIYTLNKIKIRITAMKHLGLIVDHAIR